MRRLAWRRRLLGGAIGAVACAPGLAHAQGSSQIDPADTAWMISATGLVLMMSIPGLALFYCGMVRKKNILATMAQTLLCAMLCSLLWAAAGYSLAFSGDGAILGSLDRLGLAGIGLQTTSPLAKTIPEALFMIYQMTFAVITVALVAGSVADRMRFSAFVGFAAGWLFLVYVPLAHWVWGGGWLIESRRARLRRRPRRASERGDCGTGRRLCDRPALRLRLRQFCAL